MRKCIAMEIWINSEVYFGPVQTFIIKTFSQNVPACMVGTF